MRKFKTFLAAIFVSAAATMTITAGAMAATATTATPASTDLPLEYNFQYATQNVADYGESFSDLPYTKFTVDGNKATLAAKRSSYNTNMKYVWVQINSTGGGTKINSNNQAIAECTASTGYSGVINNARYIGSMYAGTDFIDMPVTEYNIYITKKNS